MAGAQGVRAGKAYVEIGANDDKLRAALASGQRRLESFGNAVLKIGAGLTGIGAVALAPMLAMSKSFASGAGAMGDMATRTGMTTERLSALSFAAEQAGASIDVVESAIRRTQRTITDAAAGSDVARAKLERLGLTASTLAGMPPDKQFDAILEALNKIPNASDRAAAAVAMFGATGTQLIPLAAEFKKTTEIAERLGLILSTEDAAAADALGDSIDLLHSSLGALRNQIGASLAPALTSIAQSLTLGTAKVVSFVREHRGAALAIAAVGASVFAAGSAMLAFAGAIRVAHSTIVVIVGLLKIATAVKAAWIAVTGAAAVAQSALTVTTLAVGGAAATQASAIVAASTVTGVWTVSTVSATASQLALTAATATATVATILQTTAIVPASAANFALAGSATTAASANLALAASFGAVQVAAAPVLFPMLAIAAASIAVNAGIVMLINRFNALKHILGTVVNIKIAEFMAEVKAAFNIPDIGKPPDLPDLPKPEDFEATKAASIAEDAARQLRDAKIALIEDEEDRAIAAVQARSDEDIAAAVAAGSAWEKQYDLLGARELAIRKIREDSAKQRADADAEHARRLEDEARRLKEVADQGDLSRKDRIALLDAEMGKSGIDLAKARLEIEKQIAIRQAKERGEDLDLLNDEFRKRSQLLDREEAARRADEAARSIQEVLGQVTAVGQFGGTNLSMILGRKGDENLRESKETNRFLRRIADNTEVGLTFA